MTKLKDIAQETGFSITTVSRALAGYDDVNAETRQQIMQTATQMGYQPNGVARQLRNQKTDTIGIIIPSDETRFSDDFFSELVMGVGYAAAHLGYDLLLSAQTSADEMGAYQRIVGGNRVDGVIIARTRRHDPRIAYLKKANLPYVVAGRSAPDEITDYPYIDVDSQRGIALATEYLIGLGHTHIGFIAPPQELAYTAYRLAGYIDGLHHANLPYRPDYVVYGDLRREGGAQMTRMLLREYPHITAIVAGNDAMALGAMTTITDMGLRVGVDVSVTGFDNIPSGEHAHPPLTTVRQPIQEIGQHLVERLISLIHREQLGETQTLLSPMLIVRESCGKPPHRKDAPSS
jgi:LacI family transcriptional regulator